MRVIYDNKILVFSALARAVTKAGHKTHVSHLSRIIRGERAATKPFLIALARVLDKDVAEARKFIDDIGFALKEVDSLPNFIKED